MTAEERVLFTSLRKMSLEFDEHDFARVALRAEARNLCELPGDYTDPAGAAQVRALERAAVRFTRELLVTKLGKPALSGKLALAMLDQLAEELTK